MEEETDMLMGSGLERRAQRSVRTIFYAAAADLDFGSSEIFLSPPPVGPGSTERRPPENLSLGRSSRPSGS